MQFIVTGYDGNDDKALERRMNAREAHLNMVDESGNMKGSMMVVEFASREQLDAWLKVEPYIINNVWQRVEIVECKVAAAFVK